MTENMTDRTMSRRRQALPKGTIKLSLSVLAVLTVHAGHCRSENGRPKTDSDCTSESCRENTDSSSDLREYFHLIFTIKSYPHFANPEEGATTFLPTPSATTFLPTSEPTTTLPLVGANLHLLTPGANIPLSTPSENTPLPTPGATTPVSTPGETTPVSTPGETTPLPTPRATTPVPTPRATTPLPTPGATTPVPTPGATTPVPTPGETTLLPTPDETTPVPTPGAPIPVPTLGQTTLLPTPDQTTPVPTPGATTPVQTIKVIFLSKTQGFVQTTVTSWYGRRIDSWARVDVPKHHVVMVSVRNVVFTILMEATLYAEGTSDDDRVWTTTYNGRGFPTPFVLNTSVLHFYCEMWPRYRGDYFSLHFSFHNYSFLPQQLANGRWNCSVPHWADFRHHFPCNLVADCDGGQDEAACPYTSEHCGPGRVTAGGKCFLYVTSQEAIRWEEAAKECKKRNAQLVSLNTADKWHNVSSVLRKWNGQRDVYIGLRTSTAALPRM